MLHPARVVTFLIALAFGLVLHHLVGEVGTDDQAGPSGSQSELARENTPVANELSRRWKLLPQVIEAHAGYSGGDDFGVIVADAVCDKCRRKNLLSRLARDIWVSDLKGITSFKVRVAHDDSRGQPLTRTWNVRREARALYNRYGNGLVDPDTAP
jgi:hypothetical protein